MPHQLHTELRDRIESHAWLTRHPRLFPLLVFGLVIVSIIAGALTTEAAERRNESQRFDAVASEIARFVRQAETTHSAMLRGSALYLSQLPATQADFEVLAGTGLQSIENQVAEGIGWAMVDPISAAVRRVKIPVTYLAPNTARNRRAIGFDLYSEANRRAAIDMAVQTRKPLATAPVVLAQDGPTSTDHGFLLIAAVRQPGGGFKGVVYAPYKGQSFLTAIEARLAIRPQFLALDDVTGGIVSPISALGARADGLAYASRMVMFGGRQWRITVGLPVPTILARSTMLIIMLGLMMAALALLLARQFVNAALDERKFYEWQTAQLQVRDTLMLELNHRVKNTLANVLSIITLTRRRSADLDEFADGLVGRIRALSATHDILTAQQWREATLDSIIRAELAPYLSAGEEQAQLSGPAVPLAPNTALSLGLAVHELATNAAKYGALSVPDGSVSVSWRPIDDETVQLDWTEQGGPAVSEPERTGFGTSLLRKTVSHELGRDVVMTFSPEGLKATLYIPTRAGHEFALRQKR